MLAHPQIEPLLSPCDRVLQRREDREHRRLEVRVRLRPAAVPVLDLLPGSQEQLHGDRLPVDLCGPQAQTVGAERRGRVAQQLGEAHSSEVRGAAALPAGGVQREQAFQRVLDLRRLDDLSDGAPTLLQVPAQTSHLSTEVARAPGQPRLGRPVRQRDRGGGVGRVAIARQSHALPSTGEPLRPARADRDRLEGNQVGSWLESQQRPAQGVDDVSLVTVSAQDVHAIGHFRSQEPHVRSSAWRSLHEPRR